MTDKELRDRFDEIKKEFSLVKTRLTEDELHEYKQQEAIKAAHLRLDEIDKKIAILEDKLKGNLTVHSVFNFVIKLSAFLGAGLAIIAYLKKI